MNVLLDVYKNNFGNGTGLTPWHKPAGYGWGTEEHHGNTSCYPGTKIGSFGADGYGIRPRDWLESTCCGTGRGLDSYGKLGVNA